MVDAVQPGHYKAAFKTVQSRNVMRNAALESATSPISHDITETGTGPTSCTKPMDAVCDSEAQNNPDTRTRASKSNDLSAHHKFPFENEMCKVQHVHSPF